MLLSGSKSYTLTANGGLPNTIAVPTDYYSTQQMIFTSADGLVYEPNFVTYTIAAGVLSIADSYVGTLEWYYLYTYESASDPPATTLSGMSYLEMQDAVESELGFKGTKIIGKLPANFIKDKLNVAQREVAKKTLSILDDTTFNTVIGTEQYNLSAYFIEGSVTRVTYDGTALPEVPQSYRNNYTSTDTGTPAAYYLRGRKIGLLPIPDAVEAVIVEHSLFPLNMVNDADISQCPEVTHRSIVLLAAFYVFDYMDDNEAADKYNDYIVSLEGADSNLNANHIQTLGNPYGW